MCQTDAVAAALTAAAIVVLKRSDRRRDAKAYSGLTSAARKQFAPLALTPDNLVLLYASAMRRLSLAERIGKASGTGLRPTAECEECDAMLPGLCFLAREGGHGVGLGGGGGGFTHHY